MEYDIWSLQRMKFDIKRIAFSLTELLIVLVIAALLFAALAPIMSKRHQAAGKLADQVWIYTDGDQGDAWYDSAVSSWTSAGYVGVNPADLHASDYLPYSKLVLKAKESPLQNMIQFRYGDGDGVFTGVFTVDKNGNLITTTNADFHKGSYNTYANSGYQQGADNYNNTAIGMGTMSSDRKASWGSYKLAYSITTVGTNSTQNVNGTDNLFIGSNTGRGISSSGHDMEGVVGIGANVLGLDDSVSFDSVYLGSLVASAGFNTPVYGYTPSDNVIIGSHYNSTTVSSSTIVGYDTLVGSPEQMFGLTAIGYGACSALPASNNASACIGYSSAWNDGVAAAVNSTEKNIQKWSGRTVYLGGSPHGFGGRSVLEVRDLGDSSSKGYINGVEIKPHIGPTVVMNSNLVVRGNVYFPTVDGVLRPHVLSYFNNGISASEKGKDKCCRKLFRSKRWNTSSCSIWNVVFGGLIGAALTIGGFVSLGATTALALGYAAIWGGTAGGLIGSLFSGDGYDRGIDPLSLSTISFPYDSTTNPSCVMNADDPYPNTVYCPDLQLSDIRLKENITENTDALDKIMLVMPYNYTFKADNDKTPQVGVIAQDLQKYSPNSVSTDEDGYLKIRWDELFYASINSVKSLDKKLTKASTDIDNLENEAKSVQNANKNLQNRIDNLNKRVNKLEK